MAETKLLKRASGGIAEFSATDTIPSANLPVSSIISPSQITSDQDNYNPTGWADADIVRLDFGAGGRAITGFTAWTNTRSKRIVNTSANFAYIPCEHPDSSAANRVVGICDHIIAPYGTLVIEYDDTSDRVRVVGNSFNPAALTIGGGGGFYRASVGATNGSDWNNPLFSVSGGDNDVVEGSTTLPGAWEIHTSTSSTGASAISFTKPGLNFLNTAVGHKIVSCFMYLNTLSDASNTYTFAFGLKPASGTTLNDTNEVSIRYSHGLNSGKWLGVTRASSVESTVDLGVTVAVNTLYNLTVCYDDAQTEARFYVNGAYCGRSTSNIPNNSNVGTKALIIKSAGTTLRAAYIASISALNVI